MCCAPLSPQAVSLKQLRLLGRLLLLTWQDGEVWGPPSAADKQGSDGNESHLQQQQQEQGQEEGGEGAWSCSALRDCWTALGVALVRDGHYADVLRLVDATAARVSAAAARTSAAAGAGQGAKPRPAPLAQADVDALVACAKDQGQEQWQGVLLAVCIGALSPCANQRRRALGSVASLRLPVAASHQFPAGATPATAEPLLLCALAAIAAADAAKPGAAPSAASSKASAEASAEVSVSCALYGTPSIWQALCSALSSLPPHPAIAACCAPLTPPAGRTPIPSTTATAQPAAAAASELSGCLMPCLVSRLVQAGYAPGAATLVASRLGLHRGLSALDGSLQLLDRYLQVSTKQ